MGQTTNLNWWVYRISEPSTVSNRSYLFVVGPLNGGVRWSMTCSEELSSWNVQNPFLLQRRLLRLKGMCDQLGYPIVLSKWAMNKTYWVFNRDPCNVSLQSPYSCVIGFFSVLKWIISFLSVGCLHLVNRWTKPTDCNDRYDQKPSRISQQIKSLLRFPFLNL